MTDEQTELFMANKELVPWVLINKLKISPSESFFDDLKQEGYIALMQSCEGFDPDRGVKFATYPTWLIYRKTLMYLQLHRYPISRSDQIILGKYYQARQGGMTIDEFCETHHVKKHVLNRIFNQLNPVNLDSTVEESMPGADNDMTYAEVIADPATLTGLHVDDDDIPLSMDEIKDAIMVVANNDAIRPQRDAWIEYCYALIYAAEHGEKAVSEKKQVYLANKYGISQGYASRVVSKGMRLLQKELKKKLKDNLG